MLTWLSYVLSWLMSHFYVVIAAGIVVWAIIMGFRWALRHGLKAILIMGLALLLTGCFLGVLFGGILLTSEMATTLPDFLCDKLEFCPPEDAITPDNSGGGNSGGGSDNGGGGGQSWVPGTYTIQHESGSATLRDGPSQDAEKLGEIPNGTQVTVTEFCDSNCVEGVCFRAHVAAVGDFPAGWVHACTLSKN